MKCPTCGDELKTIMVLVPVYEEMPTGGGGTPINVLLRYDEEEQVCDCPRCNGAY